MSIDPDEFSDFFDPEEPHNETDPEVQSVNDAPRESRQVRALSQEDMNLLDDMWNVSHIS